MRFVVVDGAQELSHGAVNLLADYCDFYLAGCQKWLAAHYPMGLGFFGRARTRGYVETMLERYLEAEVIDDALLRLERHVADDKVDPTLETVALSALFTCREAVAQSLRNDTVRRTHPILLGNLDLVASAINETSWRTVPLDPSLRTGIVLA